MSLQFLHSHDAAKLHDESVWVTQWAGNDTVFSASADGQVIQWDASSGQQLRAQPAHPLGIVSLSASPDGNQVLSNSLEGTTCLWDIGIDQIVGKKESYVRGADGAEPAWSVSLSPKGGSYASTGGTGNVTIHSTEPASFGKPIQQLVAGRSKFGLFVSHSPDGSRVALSSETGQIYLFDIESGSLVATFTSHAMCVRSVAWSPDNSLLLSASDDKRLVLHDVRTSSGGKMNAGVVATLTGHSSWVLSAAISPDNRLALSGSADKTVRIWDIAARAAVSTIQESGEVWSVSWKPKSAGGAFVMGGEEGNVRWWRAAGTA